MTDAQEDDGSRFGRGPATSLPIRTSCHPVSGSLCDELDSIPRESYVMALPGGRSSMVEPQIVVLDVAGSNPVGHPILAWRARSIFPLAPGLNLPLVLTT